jgi:hypothetical protein
MVGLARGSEIATNPHLLICGLHQKRGFDGNAVDADSKSNGTLAVGSTIHSQAARSTREARAAAEQALRGITEIS